MSIGNGTIRSGSGMARPALSDSTTHVGRSNGGKAMSGNGAQRLKLLLITSGCDGMDVGEAWNSFQWASRLGQRHDVTLLTFRHRDRPSTVPQLPGVRVIEWLDWPFIGRWDRFNSMLK